MYYLYILPIFELLFRVLCTSHIWREKGPGGPVSRKSRYLYGPEIKYLTTTPFSFINWQFDHVRCKTIETSIFTVNGDSLPGPLIIGTFEKRAPGDDFDSL